MNPVYVGAQGLADRNNPPPNPRKYGPKHPMSEGYGKMMLSRFNDNRELFGTANH